MDRWLEWLLDLHDIRLGRDAPLLLRWDAPFRAWELLCFAIVAIAWIVLVYRRESISWSKRAVLGAVRGAVVALVAAVLAQPTLVLQQNRMEPSHVVLALDTSLSMANHDTYADPSRVQTLARGAGLEGVCDAGKRSRLEWVKAALLRERGAPLRRLLARQQVHLCTFAGQVESKGFFASSDLPAATGTAQAGAAGDLVTAVADLEADGSNTDVPGAITNVIDKAGGRRLSAILLATDGRSTQPTNADDAIQLARGRQIPVFTIPIGSPMRPFDLELARARSKETAFIDDLLVVEGQVLGHGLTAPTPVDVQLVDAQTEAVAASERVVIESSSPEVTVELRTRPTQPGVVRYRVVVVPVPSETTTDNNAAALAVTILDRRLRVLYVDGYPRYEYRYLKNALLREPTIDLSVLLLEADEEFIQEGTEPIRRFPETPEELNRYDVVLFGDVDPRGGWLSSMQMTLLLNYVGSGGGGFGLIAGERAAPHRFPGTPLEKLIPVRIDPSFYGRYESTLVDGFHVRVTPEGGRSGIFRWVADAAANERLWGALPELYWLARTLGSKPGASVLAEHPSVRAAAAAMPIVVTGRYGAGKLFFQATDDTWRWRRHMGELLHDTYWVQVVRELMRTTGASTGRRWTIHTDRRVYPYGASVRTQVEILDAELLAGMPDATSVGVTEAALEHAAFDTNRLSLTPSPQTVSGFTQRFQIYRVGPESNLLEGSWIPPRPGNYTLEPAEIAPLPDEHPVPAAIKVEPPNLETRRPEADEEMLARLAEMTGGRIIPLDGLETAFGEIPDRSVQIPDDVIEPLWDSKLALGLFVTVLLIEWICRKAFDLL